MFKLDFLQIKKLETDQRPNVGIGGHVQEHRLVKRMQCRMTGREKNPVSFTWTTLLVLYLSKSSTLRLRRTAVGALSNTLGQLQVFS